MFERLYSFARQISFMFSVIARTSMGWVINWSLKPLANFWTFIEKEIIFCHQKIKWETVVEVVQTERHCTRKSAEGDCNSNLLLFPVVFIAESCTACFQSFLVPQIFWSCFSLHRQVVNPAASSSKSSLVFLADKELQGKGWEVEEGQRLASLQGSCCAVESLPTYQINHYDTAWYTYDISAFAKSGNVVTHGTFPKKQTSVLIFVLRDKGGETKKRIKEEAIEKGGGPPTRSLSLRFCQTWTKRYLITSQTRVKRASRILHQTMVRIRG